MTANRRRLAIVVPIIAMALGLGVAAVRAQPRPGMPGETRESLASRSLPRLRPVRTLPAPKEELPFLNLVSGTSNLTWSPDGERLAAYVRNGLAIMIWSPDGAVQHEIPRYNKAGLTSANVLGFLSGHSQLLTGPAASDSANVLAVEDVAFSVVDAETGSVIHNVVGPNPGKSSRENIVSQAAISPNQRLVAVIYNVVFDQSADRRIGIYSTDDWQRIAAIPFGQEGEASRASAIAFSPDGTMLAVAYRDKFGENNRVDIFNTGSWKLIQSIKAFPDAPPKALLLTVAVRFSHDGSKIAIIPSGGGLANRYPNGQVAPKGAGTLVPTDVPEPLRVFSTSDGSRIASGGGFVGGGRAQAFDWSPTTNFIEFLDVYKDLYLWDPTTGDPPQKKCEFVETTTAALLSPDGKLLAQGFAGGVNLYEMLDNREGDKHADHFGLSECR